MSGPYLSVQSYFGLGKETTRGTAVAPGWYLPISPNPTLTPDQKWQKDDSLRGSPVDVYNDVALVRNDAFDFKGFVFADTWPVLMKGILGGVDTVTGTVAPYTHAIPLLNSAAVGSQPPSYTGVDVDQIEESSGTYTAKQWTGGQLSSVALNFAATGALNYTAKYLGNPFTEVAAPSASFSTEVLIPAWNGTLSLGGSSIGTVLEGTLTIDRKAEAIFTVGQQGPYRLWAAPISVTGKLTVLALENDPNMANSLAYDKQVFDLTFTDPQSNHNIYLQMSQVQTMNPKVDRSKTYPTIQMDFTAEANTTDTATGYSPLTTKTVNATSSAF